MKKISLILLLMVYLATGILATEYHVSINGNDQNDGSEAKPVQEYVIVLYKNILSI